MVSQDYQFLTDCVDEVAIVGNKDDGRRVGTCFSELEKKSLQPDNTEKVKKIRGFIEDQDVGVLEKSTCQIRSHFPSSGQSGNLLVVIGLRKTKTRKNSSSLHFKVCDLSGLEL